MFNFKFDIEARLKFQVKRDIQSSILKFDFEGDAWNWSLMLRLEVEALGLKVKFENEDRSWSFNPN